MAPTKRTKAKIASDRVQIAERYLKGQYQHQIAEALGMTQVMVSYDLAAIQSEWRDIPLSELNELRNKELARIDQLERTYWEAWEKSQQPKEVTNTAKEGDRLKVGKRTEQRNGNPAYLQGVERCISARVRILGLDAPIKNEVTGAEGAPLYVVALPQQSTSVESWIESVS